MASVNKVILVGHIGKTPEIKYMTNGDPVATFSLATTENWKDKSGEKQSKTEWHRIVIFGKLAGIVEQYLDKGSQIYIEGKLQTRKWQNKEGVDVYTTEIIADRMQMLGGKRDDGEERPQQKQDSGGNGFEDMEDNIPF